MRLYREIVGARTGRGGCGAIPFPAAPGNERDGKVNSNASPLGGIVLVSPTRKGNGLGRAISMAGALSALAPTRVVAYDDGPLWRGGVDAGIPVLPFRQASDLRRLTADLDPRRPSVLWSVKALPCSYWPVRRVVSRTDRHLLHLLDIDDFDAALSRDFRSQSIRHRLIIHPAHPLHPRRIERVVAHARRQGLPVTSSSAALLRKLGFDDGRPSAVLPHVTLGALAAAVARSPAVAQSGTIRLGFVGTARRHKGLAVILELLAGRPDLELHVLRNEMTSELSRRQPQVVPHETAAAAYACTDVVVLPQDPVVLGARYQLPAKLLDALHFGKPVLVTPTPGTKEHVADAVEFVTDWHDHKAIYRTLDEVYARLPEIAARNREIYNRRFSAEAVRPALEEFLSAVLRADGELGATTSCGAPAARPAVRRVQ